MTPPHFTLGVSKSEGSTELYPMNLNLGFIPKGYAGRSSSLASNIQHWFVLTSYDNQCIVNMWLCVRVVAND